MGGGVRKILNFSELKKYYFIYPSITEQTKIVSLLNKKCSEIDALTADIQTQIETLEEYKKSVITEAVTKGLDPNVEMKDSGVEWIGKISKTFKVSRIKFCYKVILGKMINSTQYPEENMSNYLCAANIKWGGVDTSIHKKMYISEKEKLNILLNKGDILIMEGGNAGTACIYNNEFYPCYIQNSVHRCFGINGFINNYLYYWMFVVFHSDYINLICNKATIRHYTKEKVDNTPIVVPSSLSEQKKITDYLDQKCSEIDQTISEKQQQLETLAEYKKSLIYEYVTGKKEVA